MFTDKSRGRCLIGQRGTRSDRCPRDLLTIPARSLAEALDRRQREGRPVRIGLIGAGQMGTDIIVQTALMHGHRGRRRGRRRSRERVRRLQRSPATARARRRSPTTPQRPPARIARGRLAVSALVSRRVHGRRRRRRHRRHRQSERRRRSRAGDDRRRQAHGDDECRGRRHHRRLPVGARPRDAGVVYTLGRRRRAELDDGARQLRARPRLSDRRRRQGQEQRVPRSTRRPTPMSRKPRGAT